MDNWQSKEDRCMRRWTRTYPNLGNFATSIVKGHHNIIRDFLNQQLGLEDSASRLCRKIKSLSKDIINHQEQALRVIPRLAQHPVFRLLQFNITNFALQKVADEYRDIKQLLEMGNGDLGPCDCGLLYRFSLPCKHHLRRAYLTGCPIPKSLVHPR